MEEKKQVIRAENLSDENDRLEEEEEEEDDDDDDLGTKRAYLCIFCKRGFTNAQALGGHMNIHRKQRPKPKHILVDSALDSKTYEELLSSGYLAGKTKYHRPLQADQRSCQKYYQPSSQPIPRYPPASYSLEPNLFAGAPRAQPLIRRMDHSFISDAARAQPLIRGIEKERMGANLSLGIGHHHVDENQVRVGVKSKVDVVDLELRLGCHPC